MAEKKRIIVVGAGLGGLAAAARLAHGGHDVTVFDPNEHAGGKMNVHKDKGFLFDMGPTILTYPQVLDKLFRDVGRRREDYLELLPVDPQWRAIFEDGEIIDLWSDRKKMEAEISRHSPSDVESFRRMGDYSRRMYGYSEKFFFWKNVGGLKDIFTPKDFFNPRGLSIARGMDLFSTVGSAVHRHFKSPHLRQIWEHFMQYVGSSPWEAPAILSAIQHIQMEFGVWYPLGGTNKLAEALRRLAEDMGVRFHLGEFARRISIDGRRATGVETAERLWSADAVVCNSDFVRTHTDLLPPTETLRKIRTRSKDYEPACSGVVIYFGVNRKYDILRHHDFFFSRDPLREFDDIYKRGVPAQDPTLCVCSPSRTDPSAAPEGCENVYVLVHTPYLRAGHDWSSQFKPYRDLIVRKLERNGLMDFEKFIVTERWFSPDDLESFYRVDRGAIYGIASHGRLKGGFKPANRSKDFGNLYFCGGSVNPGPGTPMVLMSGQIAADCVLEDMGVVSPAREAVFNS